MMMEELECEFCGQSFSSVEQLESHQELLHSDELEVRELEEAMAEEDVDDHDSSAAARQFDEALEEHEANSRDGEAAPHSSDR